MPIATNDAGEVLSLGDDGQWTPAKIASNPETGAKLIFDGKAWIDAPLPKRSTDETIARGIGMPAQGFNESFARTVGFLPDTVGAGLRGFGLPSSSPGFYTELARKGVQGVATLGGLLPDAPKPETTTEKALYGAGEGIGDAASVMLPAGVIANTAHAGGLVSNLGRALAAQPVTQAVAGATGGAVREATDSPLAGLAASLATPVGMAAASRAVLPIRPNLSPETQRLIGVAQQEGIPLTAAQQTGSKPLRFLEGAFDNLPLTGGPQEAARQEQRLALNRASLSRSGTGGDVATPDVINQARARIGGVMNDIAERNVLDITPQHEAALNGIADEITQNYPADVARPVIARINEVLNHPEGRTIPGQFYKNLDSKIAKQLNDVQGVQRTALGEVRDVLRTAMDDSISPADQAAWQEARRQYANLMVTAKAASGAGEAGATGNVSPLGLRQAVDQGTGQGYKFGRGDQNDLARIGQAFLRSAPDSGTAGRSYMQGLLTTGIPGGAGGAALASGGGLTSALLAAGGGLVAPRIAQAAYNSAPMQRYLTQGIPGMAGLANQAPDMNAALALALSAPYVKNQATGPRKP